MSSRNRPLARREWMFRFGSSGVPPLRIWCWRTASNAPVMPFRSAGWRPRVSRPGGRTLRETSAHELLDAPRDPADETGAFVAVITVGDFDAPASKEVALGLEALPIQDLPLLVRDHQARKTLVDRGQRLADRVAITAGAQLAKDVLDLLGLFRGCQVGLGIGEAVGHCRPRAGN